jgi:hypothetical protein
MKKPLTKVSKVIARAVAEHGTKGPNARGEYATCCPFCELKTGEADRKYKMQLNAENGLYNCYRCGSGGKADVSEILDVEVLAEKVKVEVTLEPMPEDADPLDPRSSDHRAFIAYLRKRNLLEEALQAGVLVAARGYYAGRIIVPHIVSGQYAGFSARTIHPKVEPKYLYPKGMNRRGTLWGQDLGWKASVYVVEGVLDALALYPCGVATFGKNVTEEQLAWLEAVEVTGSRIIFCLDGDAWEECAALAMRLRLRGADDVRWCHLPPGTDPGVLKREVDRYIVG